MIDYDRDRVDEMTLALMYLVASRLPQGGRAWRTFDVATLDRLQKKGWIVDLKNRSATVEITAEGMKKAEELFEEHFRNE
jgi:hypothetical protein